VFRLAGSICRMNSRQRPHGGNTESRPSSSRQTAAILVIWYSPAHHHGGDGAVFCTKPVPEPVSTQTPAKRLPLAVMSTDATFPKRRPPTVCGLRTPWAVLMSSLFDVLSTAVNLLGTRTRTAIARS
jgi:hypothetical protein